MLGVCSVVFLAVFVYVVFGFQLFGGFAGRGCLIVYVVAGAVDRVFCRIIEYVVAGAVVLGPRSGVHCETAAYHVQAAA